MRVVRPTLKILLDDLDKLDTEADNLRVAAKNWITELDYRDGGFAADQYHISILRNRLEQSVIKYREQLALIYDFMGDKGLV